ncbi:oligosaccharide flippase family protein [Candidatus Peregrinibacteria bacterium]|nr:oligosaccharide flippase family protein [Candidatus Peregrinibacteria bacterium]
MHLFSTPLAAARGLLKRRFARDVLTLQAGSVMGAGIALLKSVLFARLLGIESFGVYATVLAFTGTASIFINFGQNQAALTFFAERHARGDRHGMGIVLKYYLTLSSLGALILLCLSFIAPTLSAILYDNAAIGTLASLAFLATLAGSFDTFFTIQLQAVREIRALTVLENINALLQLLLAGTLLATGHGVAGIFIGLGASNLLMLCVYTAVSRRNLSGRQIPGIWESIWSNGSIRPFLRQGLWIAVDKNIGNLFPQSFFFVLSIFSTPAIVGVAQLAFKISSLPKILLLPHIVRMGTTVLPSIHAHRNGLADLRKAWTLMVKHALFFHATLSIGSLLALPPLTLFFYGWEFSDVIAPSLWLLLIHIISALNVGNSPLYRLLGKAHIPALFGMMALPLQLLAFIGLLRILPPLPAFVWTVLIVYCSNLWLNGHLYRELCASEV